MQHSCRKKISTVAGRPAWRQHHKLLITPYSVRLEQIRERKPRPTALDSMLMDEEASALERWAENEQGNSGRATTQCWDRSTGGGPKPTVKLGDWAPIPDHLIDRLNRHGRIKRRLDGNTLEILAAFTAMQNRVEGALSPAQYGLIYCPKEKDKSAGFLKLIVATAKVLVRSRY